MIVDKDVLYVQEKKTGKLPRAVRHACDPFAMNTVFFFVTVVTDKYVT